MNATPKTTLNRRQPMFAEGWRLLTCLCCLFVPLPLLAASAQLLGWNNLGMHCMDSDYSVFSILPPYNTIHANLIVGGKLVTNGGYTVTYQAVAAPDGSFNATSRGKGNFINSAFALFGAQLAADQGLPVPGPESFWMPGPNNTPQGMKFENDRRWFAAYGIPITPYDDTGRKNPYPMVRLIARNGSGTPLATNDIVLPVSDEMDCRACHASGSQAAARPVGGWVGNANLERDYRLNILRLHDEKQFGAHTTLYSSALAARGFNTQGLYQGVVVDGKPVLCATCHASEALGTGSFGSIPSLTASVHSKHATVEDPDLHLALDNSASGSVATYFAHAGYVGVDQFTFAAWNGWVDSNLATGTVYVTRAVTGPARPPQDLNSDGTDDLVFQNSAGTLVTWLMNGQGQALSGQMIYDGSLGDWKLAALADINSDGKTDLIFQNTPGQIVAWLMNGQGQPTTGVTIYGGGLGDWRMVAAADLNSDGMADLVFQNAAGQVVGWFMDGQGHPTTGITIYGSSIYGWKVATMGDVNGDGIADLIWQTPLGSVVAWLMDGQGHSTVGVTLYAGTLAGWRIAGIKDMNGDGIGDLVWQNWSGSVLAWLMDGNSHPTVALSIYSSSLYDWLVH